MLEPLIDSALERGRTLRLSGARGSAGAYLVSRLRRRPPGVLLLVCPTTARARELSAALEVFSPGIEASLFPRYDTPPYDRFSPHPEIEARRMSGLYSLLASSADRPLTLVAPLSALLRLVPPRSELRSRATHLERGMTIDRDALLDVLISSGYHHTALVEERGEVASRGGILDLFPPQLERPVRIELDYREIGSMRPFDPATQRSRDELDHVVAIPPRSFRLPHPPDALLQRVRELGRDARVPESNIYALTEALGRKHAPAGIENLEPLLHERMERVFDYVPDAALVVVDDPEACRKRGAELGEEVRAGCERARLQDRLVSDPDSLYLSGDAACDLLLERRPVLLDPLGAPGPDSEELRQDLGAADHRGLRREIQARRGAGRALQPLADRLADWTQAGRRVRLLCPSPSASERLIDILRDYSLELPLAPASRPALDAWPDPGEIDVATSQLAEGFDWPGEGLVLLTEQDIFGARVRRRAVRPTRRSQAIDRLAQIQIDDLLVHAQHGICRYRGLTKLVAGGVEQEFLLLGFAGSDKLYIPIAQLRQVQGYANADEASPPLDRLGGPGWSKRKRRARRAVQDMADELLAVIAARESLAGFEFPAPDSGYEEFEARFPFEDTPDQRRATEEVLADMRRARPMDRLVCGDVGFGKTEIAARAAFLAVSAGRQVAFLVPTTVLCQQHWETLTERFAGEPVEIVSLSRLTPPGQVKRTREALANGRADIVIGTHRLLSDDVQFRNLGLVVVDEEHRFGVGQKERLKQLRKLVDVLTLSATPIPRTLQMAFTSMRDLSLIATPPPDRTAVRTQVCRFGEDIVREAVERELRRGGQVFFVHNRVETIEEFGEYLRGLLPDVRLGIGHGQMPARNLEQVMMGFMRREFDVLLCTAIIESGLDIPNANTILIHRADRFGLAQLYQLRGRVGRSDRRAHAYLFVPPEGQMSDEARRRIEAVQELSELGAGLRLATEDLEIRGAGELLGAEQSGHVASVGYDLYMEMLDEALRRVRGDAVADELDPEIKLPLPALLPEKYVPDASQRLVLYKQLAAARDDAELDEARGDLLDRFGPLPAEAENLIGVMRLKLRCRALGIEALEVAGPELVFRVGERAAIDPRRLAGLLDRPGTPLRVTPDHRIYLSLRQAGDALAESFGLLELLTPDANQGQMEGLP
ncbi:MAG: transcription-repair coupling factor [Proteobacteria bacterium]|nr:transcription-repair coupling factor [Pseudomonadota bacterium]